MSKTDAGSEMEGMEYNDVDEFATAAVRGSNNWLVTLRNAIDEGIDKWSDDFSDGRNGLMTYSEGLTSLALIKQEIPNLEEKPNWLTLRDRYYLDDLQTIISQINKDDGPRLSSAPYAPVANTDSDNAEYPTEDFTVAATFSVSAIIESLKTDLDISDEIEKDHIVEALETLTDWLLENKINEENTEADIEGVGWGWVGSNADEYDPLNTEARNYFTYSASLVLADLINNSDINIVGEAISGKEEDIISTLKKADEFLLNTHWDNNEGAWSIPSFEGTVSNDKKLVSSCYVFTGLSYISYVVDDIEMNEEKMKKMGQAMEFILEQYKNNSSIWGVTVNYTCGADKDAPEFTDGSAPYVLLDALLELANYRERIIEYIDGWNQSDITTLAREDLAPTILDQCWAGDKKFEEKGFRHVANAKSLARSEDGDPKNNMTAIYSTGVGIETFMLNFLEDKEDFGEYESVTHDDSDDTKAEIDTSGTKKIDKSTVNNTIVLESNEEDYPDEIEERLDAIRKTVDNIAGDLNSDESSKNYSEFDENTLNFIEDYYDLTRTLRKEYNNEWEDEVCDTVSQVGVTLKSNWEDKFRRKNEEMFLDYILRLYFCPDIETYEEISIPEEDAQYLLPPQYNILNEVDEEWEKGDFQDSKTRKSNVEDIVDDLIEYPWGHVEDPIVAVKEFKERFNEEN